MPTLYLVGTPIGNLEDISLRALRLLNEVDLIAAEDTRVTARLLRHYNIPTAMVSYHEYSHVKRIDDLVEQIRSIDVALVSDAGMPGLSDPGYRLVQAAIDAGHNVVPIPGPSAVIAALVGSGLPTDRFLFLGFLPRQKTARCAALQSVAQLPYTLVLYEAPHRLLDLLADVADILGDRDLCISRELTKLHEELWRGTTLRALEHFQEGQVRGEITIVVDGASMDQTRWSKSEVKAGLVRQFADGVTTKEAVSSVSEHSGWNRRDVYRLALQLKEDEDPD